ncbi:Uncharacterised protein [Chlamydia trachomatis]|nr:Uncharacterised protein [Chlamydia trachomatis]
MAVFIHPSFASWCNKVAAEGSVSHKCVLAGETIAHVRVLVCVCMHMCVCHGAQVVVRGYPT